MSVRPTAQSVGASFTFFGCAVVGFIVGFVGLFSSWVASERFDPYAPSFLASVHSLLVGGLLSLYLGVAYQLIPVVSERRCPWLAYLAPYHSVLQVVGVTLLVVGLWTGQNWALGVGGSLVLLGILILAVPGMSVLDRRRSWAPESLGLYWGFAWLLAAIGLGLWMALARLGWVTLGMPIADLRGLHLRIGLVGFFLQVILGLSHRLVPMFVVSRHKGTAAAVTALLVLNLGLLLVVVGYLGGAPTLILIGDTCLAACLLPHAVATAWQLISRMRPLGGAFWSYGLGNLGLLVCSGLWLWSHYVPAQDQPLADWMLLAAWIPLGFIPIALAVSARIIPFLAWQLVFAPQIGRRKLPTVQALWSEHVLWAEFALLLASSALWAWMLFLEISWALPVALGLIAATLAIRLGNCGYLALRIRSLTSDKLVSV